MPHTNSFAISLEPSLEVHRVKKVVSALVRSHPELWKYAHPTRWALLLDNIEDNWSPEISEVYKTDTEELLKSYINHANNPKRRHSSHPMLDCILFTEKNSCYEIHFHISHIIFDGVSAINLYTELFNRLKKLDFQVAPMAVELDYHRLRIGKFVSSSKKLQQQYLQLHSQGYQIPTLGINASAHPLLFVQEALLAESLLSSIEQLSDIFSVKTPTLLFAFVSLALAQLLHQPKLLIKRIIDTRSSAEKKAIGFYVGAVHIAVDTTLHTITDQVAAVLKNLKEQPIGRERGLLSDYNFQVVGKKAWSTKCLSWLLSIWKYKTFLHAAINYPKSYRKEITTYLAYRIKHKLPFFCPAENHLEIAINDISQIYDKRAIKHYRDPLTDCENGQVKQLLITKCKQDYKLSLYHWPGQLPGFPEINTLISTMVNTVKKEYVERTKKTFTP